MESQDGQQDRILRGCTQPTGAGFAGAGGWSARQWCFGGGGWSARPPVVLWRRRLRRPRQASTRAASVAGSWRQRRRPVRVRAVARSTNIASATASRGRRVCPRRRSWPSIPASHRTAAAEPRQPLEVGDGGGRVQGDPAAVSAAHDAVEPRRALPAHSGVAAPWLHSRTGQEGQLRGTSPTWTHLPARDTRPRSCRISGVTCGGRRSCRQVSSSRQASSQRPGRQAPSQLRQPPQLPASFQALSCQSCQTPQRPCRCQPASCAVSHQRPCRCQAGSCSASSAQRPCRCQLPSSAQRSCRSSQATRDASRIALSQHFCACARVVPFCNFVCYTFC